MPQSSRASLSELSPEHVLGHQVGSNFVSGSEGWTITGNRAGSAVTYDRTSRGLMNRYVYGESRRTAGQGSVAQTGRHRRYR